jgi:2-C-methyl-D-erythritol 4-phosphate cytidylyltransferase
MNIVAILAAGNSSRMKMDIPKQFALIDSKQTVLEFCISKFQRNSRIDSIIIVVKKEWLNVIESGCCSRFSKITAVIEGGEQRFHSSVNAIKCAASRFKDDDNLWLHDAARPFVDNELIDCIADSLLEKSVIVPVLPVRDTIYKISDNNEVLHIPKRASFVAAQTPQAARLSLWKKAVADIDHVMSPETFTDDISMLLYLAKTKIFTIEGMPENRKITFRGDI